MYKFTPSPFTHTPLRLPRLIAESSPARTDEHLCKLATSRGSRSSRAALTTPASPAGTTRATRSRKNETDTTSAVSKAVAVVASKGSGTKNRDSTVTAVKRPLSPTSTLSDVSDGEKIAVSPATKRVKRKHTADFKSPKASSKEAGSNAPILSKTESVTEEATIHVVKEKQPIKMSSDGEDFEYEDDTGFDEDVNMDGE